MVISVLIKKLKLEYCGIVSKNPAVKSPPTMTEQIIPNLKNACIVLEKINAAGRPLGISEIVNLTKLPRTTVVRILNTFEEQNFLKLENKKYTIGCGLAMFSQSINEPDKVVILSETYLRKLTGETGETSHIGIFNEGKVLIAKVVDSPMPLHAASREGVVADIHCSATGKTLLAYLALDNKAFLKKLKLNRRTDNTITDPGELVRELMLIKKRGYAVDNEEYHEHVRCLAAPVFDKTGRVVASIGITAPSIRFEKKRIPEIAKIVLNVASLFSAKL